MFEPARVSPLPHIKVGGFTVDVDVHDIEYVNPTSIHPEPEGKSLRSFVSDKKCPRDHRMISGAVEL